ncbi:MAG: alkaline protease secretion ATP-binding protein AprD [Rickettsiaceae bacterium]|jgi:PrtD family type I secretion system ABC transporter|nr:alkaline protease secretion ATP-binding protein AprD [Rickettsiaceae bacterium]
MEQETNIEVFKRSLEACRAAFKYAFLFSFISNLMLLVIPMYSLQVLDRVISSGSLETLLMLTLVVMLALSCLTLIQMVKSSMLSRLAAWLDRKLAPILFSHSVTSSAQKRTLLSGSQHLSDLGNIKSFLIGPALSAILDSPWSIIFIVVLFFIHPVIGVISIVSGILLLVMAYVNEAKTKPIFDATIEHTLKSSHYADIASRNAEAVEAMGMIDNILKIWHDAGDKALALQSEGGKLASVISGITKFFRQMVQISITGVGAYYVLQHQMTVGGMIAAGILVGRALSPFENAISSWKGFVTARKSLSRLTKSLENAPQRSGSIELPAPEGKINVENVYFAPVGTQKPTIKGISFTLDAGELLAIIGPSASGKSTIAKLLTGVWKPASGNVRLDNADVYSWSRASFGQYVGYLPQDVELFAGSVKANIARMDMQAKDENIIKAAKMANVHDLILRLPNGYETEIGIDGTSLSAGQRQRIALARAFYGNMRFIVLDEPNANLDSEGDAALAGALANAKANKITVIIISHRPAILQAVSKVLVMQDGVIAKFGTPEEINQAMQHGGNKRDLKVIK